MLIGAGDSANSPFSFLSFPPPGGTLTKELVPNSLYQPGGEVVSIQGQLFFDKLTDHDVTQVQVIDHDLCNAHEDLFTLHPPVVTWKCVRHRYVLFKQTLNSPQTVT